MPDLSEDAWVSLKVHVGVHPSAADFFIASVIPQVLVAHSGISGWFFLRSLDGYGPHVVLRLRGRPGEKAALHRSATLACNLGLDGLGALPIAEYRPLVLRPEAFEHAGSVDTPVAVRTTNYEPEVEKYGGETGIAVAEELFEHSSRIAVAALRDDIEGECSRKTLAPCLMSMAASVFAPKAPASFWHHYCMQWLGGDSAFSRDWRGRFLAHIERLREEGVSLDALRAELPSEATALLANWEKALRTAHAAYRRLDTIQAFPRYALGFHFIHMMNNRLGIHFLDEAYLATFLEQHTVRGVMP